MMPQEERGGQEGGGWFRSLRISASRSDPFGICRRESFGNSLADSVSFRFPLRQILEGSPLHQQHACGLNHPLKENEGLRRTDAWVRKTRGIVYELVHE